TGCDSERCQACASERAFRCYERPPPTKSPKCPREVVQKLRRHVAEQNGAVRRGQPREANALRLPQPGFRPTRKPRDRGSEEPGSASGRSNPGRLHSGKRKTAEAYLEAKPDQRVRSSNANSRQRVTIG